MFDDGYLPRVDRRDVAPADGYGLLLSPVTPRSTSRGVVLAQASCLRQGPPSSLTEGASVRGCRTCTHSCPSRSLRLAGYAPAISLPRPAVPRGNPQLRLVCAPTSTHAHQAERRGAFRMRRLLLSLILGATAATLASASGSTTPPSPHRRLERRHLLLGQRLNNRHHQFSVSGATTAVVVSTSGSTAAVAIYLSQWLVSGSTAASVSTSSSTAAVAILTSSSITAVIFFLSARCDCLHLRFGQRLNRATVLPRKRLDPGSTAAASVSATAR